MNIFRVMLIILLYTNFLPSFSQSGDELCDEKCKGVKNADYETGRLSEDGSGTCNEDEDIVEAICCCSPKKTKLSWRK